MAGFTAKPKLVCLAGLLCDDRMWQGVAAQLEQDADVEIMSFAGFDDLTAMAQHVLSSVEGDFALAGHSMGGRVALEIYRLAPQRITHLALLNTGVHPKSDQEIPGRMRLIDAAKSKGMPALARQWLVPMMSPKGLQDAELMANLTQMVESYSVDDFEKQIHALIQRPNAEAQLAQISVPTLLLSGTQDTWSPVEQHRLIQHKIVGSELVVIEDAGHMAPVEAPIPVANALKSWLQKSRKRLSEQTLESMLIEWQCQKLVTRSINLLDQGRWQELASCYAEDGVLYRPSAPTVKIAGRDAILDSFTARPAKETCHALTNLDADIINETHVVVTSRVVLFAGAKKTDPIEKMVQANADVYIGRFVDEIKKIEGEWLIIKRQGSIELNYKGVG
ncbi:alpha/beta fold hydrolase [Marinomonas sp. M1K-6]|uniref:Alpha/beta fold hydrolase n=1 Tax=Marinomonas profundi TaxID=2726122 RepID=A0A847R103_9GAMM|nr:alpha/beta fold hydrolase [Marinomonas profundi]NLQ17305.1 alpha/beta fold hydrolase [Marinomonas profundi]UDV01834.1 alpha/beta fold hydrolase [Marinomonas profundi]